MQTFYSIIYCPIRSVADEKVSVALLLRDKQKLYFRFSHDKLKIIKELLPDPAYRLLKANLKNIESYFSKVPNDQFIENTLFGDLPIFDKDLPFFVEPNYISYLNKYSNNLLQFSKPNFISIEIDDTVFNRLYQKFVYEFDIPGEKGIDIYQRVRKKLNSSIKGRVNIDIELTSEIVENLVVPTRVWFIGQNDLDVTGEVFDFSKSTYFLESELMKHLNLIHTLENIDSRRGTHFVVGMEPSKKLAKNHSIWNNIRKLNYIKYTPAVELDGIRTYLNEHNVNPYISNNSNPDENFDVLGL